MIIVQHIQYVLVIIETRMAVVLAQEVALWWPAMTSPMRCWWPQLDLCQRPDVEVL